VLKGVIDMKGKWLARLVTCTLFWVFLTSSSWAGQVVTEEVRWWAEKALKQEKALEAITEPNTVAVLYFNNKTGWSNLNLLEKGLTLMLITDLSKIKEIKVVERVKLQALVEELDLGVSGLVEPDLAPRVGKLLGAERLVGGDIIKGKNDEFQLKSSLLKVPTEKVLSQSAAKGELVRELFRMEKDLLFEIVEDLEIEISPKLEAELREPLTSNLNALLYLFQGIRQSDSGNYEKAAQSYQKALQEDPSLSPAKDSLQEVDSLGLIPARRKKSGALLRSLRDGTSLTDRVIPDEPVKRSMTPADTERRGDTGQVEVKW
jgi:TolB-like protein